MIKKEYLQKVAFDTIVDEGGVSSYMWTNRDKDHLDFIKKDILKKYKPNIKIKYEFTNESKIPGENPEKMKKTNVKNFQKEKGLDEHYSGIVHVLHSKK